MPIISDEAWKLDQLKRFHSNLRTANDCARDAQTLPAGFGRDDADAFVEIYLERACANLEVYYSHRVDDTRCYSAFCHH